MYIITMRGYVYKTDKITNDIIKSLKKDIIQCIYNTKDETELLFITEDQSKWVKVEKW